MKRARRLRPDMGLPEVLLWRELRRGGDRTKLRRQHPYGRWVLDFACLEARLAVEIDGEAHDRGNQPARDDEKDRVLEAAGFRVVRIAAGEVLRDPVGLADSLVRMCGGVGPLHHPAAPGGSPPRPGEDLW